METKLYLHLTLDIQKRCNSCISIKLVETVEQYIKMSFCLRTNKSFSYLLGDKQGLSLGEFDELKIHPFSVHFSD